MKLETQLEQLAELGLVLNPGITIEDLLFSGDRQTFESEPFDRLLFSFGMEVEREPWGRRFCDRVWSFDTECIAATGDYVKIANNLCLLASNPNYLGDLADSIDFETGDCWLEYTLRGERRHLTIEPNDDWADMMAISYVMEDLQQDDKQFYAKDNGQAMILFYLDRVTAERLSDLGDEDLDAVVPT